MGDFSGLWRQERRRRARKKNQGSADSAMASRKSSHSRGDKKSRWLSSDEASAKAGYISPSTKNLSLPRRKHSNSESPAAKSLNLPRRKNSITNLRDLLEIERVRKIQHQEDAPLKVPRSDSFRIEDLVALRPTLPPFDVSCPNAADRPVSQNLRIPMRTRSSGSVNFCVHHNLQEDEDDTFAAPINLRSPLPPVALLDCEINSAVMLPKLPLRKDSIMDIDWSKDNSSNSGASGDRGT